MADQGMLSLFGDDAGLFSDGLDGLGDCFPHQSASGQSSNLVQQTNATLGHEHQGTRGYHPGLIHSAGPGPVQPKMGQVFDHNLYGSYDQPGAPGGRMMGQNGPNQGAPNVNAALNGMAGHYHNNNNNNTANSGNSHHGYTGDAGAGGGGGGVWSQQQQQQSRSAYQQPPTQPGGGPNQMGSYHISQGNYSSMQGPSTPNAGRITQHYPPQSMAPPPAQDSSHYLGHVGMGGNQLRHTQPQPQPQNYPNMGHASQYPLSPSRQPPHAHQHQQSMGSFGSGQYPGYQAQYGPMGPNLAQAASANVSANNSHSMAPGQLGHRFSQGSGPATGQQSQRYPSGPSHQTHSAQMQQQTGQQGQPMHTLNHPPHPQSLPQSQNQPQSHLTPPAQGSYSSPSSMSPMRVLGTPTPPPQQGRPPSTGLAGPAEVSGYTTLQSSPNAIVLPQRTPQTPMSATHQQPHNMPPNSGQMYPGMGLQLGPQINSNRSQQVQETLVVLLQQLGTLMTANQNIKQVMLGQEGVVEEFGVSNNNSRVDQLISSLQHSQSMAPPPAQDSSHYLGHVGMGGNQLRHTQPQPQPQNYPTWVMHPSTHSLLPDSLHMPTSTNRAWEVLGVASTLVIRPSMAQWDLIWHRLLVPMSVLTTATPWHQANLAIGLARAQAQQLDSKVSDTPLDHHIRPILPRCSSRQGNRASLCTP
ncbi:chromodomain-helicase-DNA-binding protein 7-like [Thalassophryne amazonica]|uniref:chromodomain-helicase-DNA-binding protein 7-like n=1 Tax=Thalassophryne amazonica TaxID=390379 RepID=UPI001471F6EF|nr:chromodomain-helicase-DNA-binding protein 7-like [Thalassophryne amazonica]